jgi:subtilisin family serine protease
MFIIP